MTEILVRSGHNRGACHIGMEWSWNQEFFGVQLSFIQQNGTTITITSQTEYI